MVNILIHSIVFIIAASILVLIMRSDAKLHKAEREFWRNLHELIDESKKTKK